MTGIATAVYALVAVICCSGGDVVEWQGGGGRKEDGEGYEGERERGEVGDVHFRAVRWRTLEMRVDSWCRGWKEIGCEE